jgi:hypothetical protein
MVFVTLMYVFSLSGGRYYGNILFVYNSDLSEVNMECLKSAFTNVLFESWFRNSKVVDPQGQPLVLFHATVADFDPCAFNPLSHFGSEMAADEIALYRFMDGDDGCRVFPVFLSIKNPLRILDLNPHDKGNFKDYFSECTVKHALSVKERQYCFDYDVEKAPVPLRQEASTSNILPVHMQSVEHLWVDRLIRTLESKGYDGFMYRNDHEDVGSFSYVSFRKEQVRPALIEDVYPQATHYFCKDRYRSRLSY